MVNQSFLIFLALILLCPILHSLASDVDSAKLVFYYGPTFDDHEAYNFSDAASILNHPKFNKQLPTNCFYCGYTASQEDFSTRVMIDSYLKNENIQLLTIDWKTLNSGSYVEAQNNLIKLGPKIAKAFIDLFNAGMNKENFILVGHSLGAHGSGYVGRNVIEISKEHTLPRISALDPANPDYYKDLFVQTVGRTDASFVDCIHTDAGDHGTDQSVGHADFWPNNGTAIQPGCPSKEKNSRCSHIKALAYFGESVAKASDRNLFVATRGNPSPVQMGYNCPTNANGYYYLDVDTDYAEIPEYGLIVG